MKKKIYIALFFMLAIILFTGNVFGFNRGEKVRCKIKSYKYDMVTPADPSATLTFVKNTKSEPFSKGSILEYVNKIAGSDGICQVRQIKTKKTYYIKEVNLERVQSTPDSSLTEASNRFYNEYKNKSVADFSGMSQDKLKSLSDECNLAITSTPDASLKLKLKAIQNKIVEAAKKKGMQVDSDNVIQHQIPAASTETSGQDAWGNRVQQAQKDMDENDQQIQEGIDKAEQAKDDSIYQKPELKTANKDSASSLDDMMSDADDFVKEGEIQYAEDALQDFSSTLFNIFSIVGAAVAVIIGIVIGIKYMIGSVEEKAEYKKMLVPYIVGCVVVFGAFGIWKLIVVMLESI